MGQTLWIGSDTILSNIFYEPSCLPAHERDHRMYLIVVCFSNTREDFMPVYDCDAGYRPTE